MIERIISGGQTGADQAAWRAAVAFNIPTGGWMPLGFLTEDGSRPEFAEMYGAREMPTADYRLRTEQNVRNSDGTVWFGSIDTPRAKATLWACQGMGKSRVVVIPGHEVQPSHVADWITKGGFVTVNVAGSRESKAPGIGDSVEAFMAEVFRQFECEQLAG